MQYLFAGHALDADRRELRRGHGVRCGRAASVRPPDLPGREPRPCRQQGRSHRVGLGRPDRIGFDPDEPGERGAKGGRRQRRGPKAHPHDRAQGTAFRRRGAYPVNRDEAAQERSWRTRKIAAILVADVVGYSRLAAADEERILARLRTLRSDLIDPTIAVHHGRVVKRTGDGLIVEFRSVVDAVRCAIEVQSAMVERNAGVAPDKRIEFRVGMHLGDVVEEADGDLMGDGVNIAARLEGICEPGGRLPLGRGLRAGARPGEGDLHRSRREGAQEYRATGARL